MSSADLREAMLRTLNDASAGDRTAADLRAIRSSPIISRPARTIAAGILPGGLGIMGFTIVLFLLYVAAQRYMHT